MKEAMLFGAVWKGFRDPCAAPYETSPSSHSIVMVPLIFQGAATGLVLCNMKPLSLKRKCSLR